MTFQNDQENDTRYITLLNVMACFAVVLLHTNGCFWNFSATQMYWKTANIIESVFYFAVPVFFMVSGATLIDYSDRYSTKVFFRKRIQKVVIPFVVWSLIGILFSCYVINTIDPSFIGMKYIVNSVLNASVVTTYWFFPPLINGYLCMPLFTVVEKSKRQIIFSYLVIFGYLINFLIPLLKSLLSIDVSFPFSISVASNPLIFMLAGYLISHYDFSKKQRVSIYILSATALMVHLVGTYIVSMDAGTSMKTFKNLTISIPYAAGIFLFSKTYGNKLMDGMVGKFINFVKKYTFSIYLLHRFVQSFLNYVYPFNTKSMVYRLGMPLVIIPICIILTMLLRKLPIIKHFVPE